MNTSWYPARIAPLLLAGAMAAGCSGSDTPTPTGPTPDPPQISCPAIEPVTSTTPVAVPYGDPTVAGGKLPITSSCTPPSGSTFPLGSTTVTCTATDALRRVASCTTTVSVTQPPRLQLTRFVAFGDSLTAGEDGRNGLVATGSGPSDRFVILHGMEYPTVLERALMGRYQTQSSSIAVANRGEPGLAAADPSTLGLLARALSGNQVLLLMMGTNDLYAAHSATDVAGRVTQGVNAIQSMVRMAKGSGLRVYLGTLPPMNPSGFRAGVYGWDLVADFNQRLLAIAAAESVTPVDVYTAFGGDYSLVGGDGVHPNESGYQRIADTFLNAIAATLEEQTASPLQRSITTGAFRTR